MSLVLLTNPTEYVGPGALEVLLAQGHTVLCTDKTFADPEARIRWEGARNRCHALAAQSAPEMLSEIMERWTLPDGIVCNDAFPNHPKEIGCITDSEFIETFEAVVLAPIRIAQTFLPAMKNRRTGSFVFVTSARELRPEPGYAVPTTVRAAATTFMKALAKEVAPYGIQANSVAPNYLYSEMYYPRAKFVDDPAGRDLISRTVPFGRLGQPEEIGELIAFFACGRSPFITGQVVYFTGGWP
ncbi:MAG TPA: SDR family oxidoreductase [Pseudolabrys sp.]|jgi:NAD(P)-dependent dehydrogenase (short-subunit alcohol dehydrogenase family)|nr:SDR family oxidoreductase [Pseudolabrys sp.]